MRMSKNIINPKFQSHIGAIRMAQAAASGQSFSSYFNPTLVQLE